MIPWGLHHFLEVIFDFDFDPPVYQKALGKAASKKSCELVRPISSTRHEHEVHSKKIGLLPNLKKGLASCETKNGSSPGHMGRTFSSEPFKVSFRS
jgi:hypothetical protein